MTRNIQRHSAPEPLTPRFSINPLLVKLPRHPQSSPANSLLTVLLTTVSFVSFPCPSPGNDDRLFDDRCRTPQPAPPCSRPTFHATSYRSFCAASGGTLVTFTVFCFCHCSCTRFHFNCKIAPGVGYRAFGHGSRKPAPKSRVSLVFFWSGRRVPLLGGSRKPSPPCPVSASPGVVGGHCRIMLLSFSDFSSRNILPTFNPLPVA